MFTVVAINGKQYIMKNSHIINLDKITSNVGDIIQFNNVLLYTSNTGEIFFGKPYLYNCKVSAVVCEHFAAKKVQVLKFKRRKGYMRKLGHRQFYTKIKITSINFLKGI